MKTTPLRLLTSTLGSALAAVAVTTLAAIGSTYLGANLLELYGFALFLGVPFCLGLVATLIYAYREARDLGESIGVAVIAVGIASVALMMVALEGAICLLMAAPLTLGLAVLGALVGYAIQRHGRPRPPIVGAVLMLAPALLGAESFDARQPTLRSVTTSVVVDAPPGVVWRHIVAVEPLPPPRALVFRAGIAYPTQATISGSGVGAVRRCTFSTGEFVEPITVWEPNRRLAFDVVSQPPPMRELSPYGQLHPPHLDGFMRSERGEFRLVRLAGGRTLLRGTSWYRNRMWPERYWRLWSDPLIHRIHARVLRHVDALAERDAAVRSSGVNKVLTSEEGFSSSTGNSVPHVSAVAFDLRRTAGYLVADKRGRLVGRVESPMYGTSPNVPDALAVRGGFLSRRLRLVPADSIEQIDGDSRVIGLSVERDNIRRVL